MKIYDVMSHESLLSCVPICGSISSFATIFCTGPISISLLPSYHNIEHVMQCTKTRNTVWLKELVTSLSGSSSSINPPAGCS